MSKSQNKFCNKHNNGSPTINNCRSGFTLIELIIVIAIIGILSTIVMVSFLKSQAKARDSERAADLRQIQTAVETYKEVNNKYPGTNKTWYSSYKGWKDMLSGSKSDFISDLKPYLDPLPREPKCGLFCGSTDYEMYYDYIYVSSPDSYGLDSGIEANTVLADNDGGLLNSGITETCGFYNGRYELGSNPVLLACFNTMTYNGACGYRKLDSTQKAVCTVNGLHP